ncbi:MAG: CHAD domain-containing protein [Balneolaceae bacterium]|nr:CHAD domain-containing protein [Balneolaceae bacterium]
MLTETDLNLLSSETCQENLVKLFHEFANELTQQSYQAIDTPEASTHLIRKMLKRFRAFAKLLRTNRNSPAYKQVNAFLRDQGREFSALRDAHVRHLLLYQLLSDTNYRPFAELLENLQSRNRDQVRQLESELLDEENRFERFAHRIGSNQPLSQYFLEKQTDSELLVQNYRKSFDLSRAAFQAAVTYKDTELLHEWRKRLKDFQYQTELIAGSTPADLFPQFPELEQLCDLLGEMNDYSMLACWLQSIEKKSPDSSNTSDLADNLTKQMYTLYSETEQKGIQFYSESTRMIEKFISAAKKQ